MPVSTSDTSLKAHVPRVLLRRLATAPDELVQTVEGTIVFADISGFTRLSERLARKGREGAEHLVDTINSCFTALLADAYANGGSLLKFGGDALLLWFEDEAHAVRACASAVSMRSTLRRIGRIQLEGAGSIGLRISMGVHSGAYETFLVGGSHREYLIAGPAASTAVTMEAEASAGQILLSNDTASLLPRSCLGAGCGPGVLLARSPSWQAGAGYAEPVSLPDDVVAQCLSTALRAHVLAGPVAPEHRTATATFIQFGTLDRLIGQRGAAVAASQIDELVRVVQEAADHYNVCLLGSDVAADGGKLLLSSGAPRAFGDDEERMLLALRQVIDANSSLPVRIGVNRGYAFTGEVGPPYRRTYAVMGDVVNLAARLMAKAPWGAIYATESVLRHSRTRFATTAVAPFMVKGKARPVEALVVGCAVRGVPTSPAASRLPLIGRERDLAVLQRSLAGALSGHGSLVEVAGEPGSGKSRLLAELSERAQGVRVIRTICETYTQGVPYVAWRDVLRQLLGVGGEDSDDLALKRLHEHLLASDAELLPWLPLLAIAIGVDAPSTREVEELSQDFRTAKLHEVVLRFLEFALTVPTLLLIEHAHAMDEASAGLLDALVGNISCSSWVVVATRRDVASGFQSTQSSAVRLELEPLTPQATLALAEATPEAHVIRPHMLELAVERSAGNPEFLLDLLAAAVGGSETLPDTVETAASARLDGFDPGDRALIRRAAVLGLTFRPELLCHVLPAGAATPGDATWRRLAAIFAIDPDGHVRFKRPALSEAAYDGLPFRLRRELHLAVGRALEKDLDLGRDVEAEPAVLSLHFWYARDHDRAWKYALMGAERAAARFAHADAARLYRRAIDAGRARGAEPSELARAWEALGEALRLTGEPKAALEAMTVARRLRKGDALAEARLLYHQADITERHGRLTAAVRSLNRGLRVLEGLESTEAKVWRARLIADLGGIRMRQGRVTEAIERSRQAMAEAESVGELRALARACYLLDWALVEAGEPGEATYSQRALEIYSRLGDPEREARVVINLGAFAYEEGRWEDAVELYRRGSELSLRAGNLDVAATGDANIGEILSDQGLLEEAGDYLKRARRVYSSIGQLQGVAFVTLCLGRLAMREGRHSDAVSLLQQAADDLAMLRIDYYVGFARACLAEAEAFGGDAERALNLADRLLRAPDRNIAFVRRIRAVALARLMRTADAIDELQASLTATGRSDYDVAAALDLLDALGALGGRADERDAILARLRVQWLPRPELEEESSARRGELSSALAG
ncbi:MAG TPA: adenylate/guanylate cyclase domain-containing protein [Solirubrobacteraceae bacterium]|nr:adenylate/guanylate cyclase domain-containing protein [Solirubrobacteraceae bacterium]